MTKEIVKVAIADGKTMSDVTELPVTGQPVRIKAVPNGKYVLAQGEKGVAPETVTVKRVGKDLHVTLEGGDPDQPQLIIEGFYETQGQLVGMAEDGSFHEFIATDAVQDHNAAFLIEGVSSPQVLGVETVSGMSGMSGMSGGVFGTGIGMLGAGLIGLAGLGLIGAAVAAGKDDDKKDDSPPALKAPEVSAGGDDVGSETGPLVNGGTTDDTTPTFSGVGTPGNTIVVKDGDKVIGETIIGDDGKWTFTPEPLSEGPHDFVFTEKDRLGNEGPPSPGFEIIIDLQAPAQAVISNVQDDVGVPEPIVQNGRTNDSTPTLNGQAEPGSTVEVFANGVKLGTAPVAADGTWSFTPSPLPDDTYSFTVVAVDAAGNRGLPSDPFVFSIDTVLPGTPGQGGNAGIGHVIDDNGDEIPAGSSTNDNTPTFTGSGQEPGTTVTLRDETGAVIGETVVDASGNWSVTPGTPLSDENHEIVMTVKDPVGNESLPSDPFVIVVDTVAPGTPGQDGNPGIGQVIDDNGNVIPEDGSTNDTTPTFSGSGQTPGETVTLYDGTTVIGTVEVDASGNWAITPDVPLAEGDHPITTVVTDKAGNESAPSAPYDVIIDTTAPGTPGQGGNPGIGQVVDDNGDVIPDDGTTNDTTPTFSGSGQTPGETVTLYDGTAVIGTAEVDVSGNWSITPVGPLAEGDHPITMTVTDKAGNESAPSDPYDVTVDITAPGTPGQGGNPGIGHVVNDNGDEIPAGSSTNDNTPTFTGSGQEPGSTVILRDETGTVIGEGIVDPAGNWSVTPGTPLSDQDHEIVMTVKDPAGNESLPSDPYAIIVDTVAPGTPGQNGNGGIDTVRNDLNPTTIDIGNGESTNDTTPTIVGSNQQPGDTITIYNGTDIIGTTTVLADGTWAITPSTALTEATYAFTMTVTDQANNVSLPSAPYVVTIDTTAPGTPGQGGNPGIGQVVDDNGDVIPDDGSTNDTTPTFNGSGQTPGETVTLYDGITVIGTAEVDASGNWSITPGGPLAEGDHPITMTVTDKAGNESAPSDPYDVTVDTTAPGTPGQGGNGGFEVINDSDPLAPLDINDGGFTNDNTPLFSGTGQQPDDIVKLYNNGAVVGSAIVQADGTWSFTPNPALADDTYSITMTVTDTSGNESLPSDPHVFTIDTVAPAKPGDNNDGIGHVIDNVNPSGIEEDILNGDSTNDNTPTIKGSNQLPGATVTIYNGNDIIGTTIVDATGSWEITPLTPLVDATYDLTMTVTDQAGNESVPSDPFVVIVDTTAPLAQATITGMGKDSGSDSGDYITNDGSAGRLIHGTLTAPIAANDLVQVSVDGGVTWLDAVVNPNQTWSFLDETAHTAGWEIQTRVIDASGNIGAETTQAVELDNSLINVPNSVSRVGDDVTVDLTGTNAATGDTLFITVGGKQFSHTLTQAEINAGQGVVTLPTGLSGAVGSFIADAAGNVSDTRFTSASIEDFSSLPNNWDLPLGQSQVFSNFTLTNDVGVIKSGYYGGQPQSIYIGYGTGTVVTDANFKLDQPAATVTFDVYGTSNNSASTVSYYEPDGTLIHTASLANGVVTYAAPPGVSIGSVLIHGNDNNGFTLDNFQVDTQNGVIEPHAQNQLIDSAAQYFGDGDEANIFSLADATLMASPDMAIHGNGGIDTLMLTGALQVLDLTALGEKVSSVEVMDITGTGNNTLTLSLGDVLEQGQTSLFTSDNTVQMMVKGNAGDVVNLDDQLAGTDPGDWSNSGTVDVGGVTYNVFSHSTVDAELLVQQGVTTNLV